jgi:hypothetical protein
MTPAPTEVSGVNAFLPDVSSIKPLTVTVTTLLPLGAPLRDVARDDQQTGVVYFPDAGAQDPSASAVPGNRQRIRASACDSFFHLRLQSY